MPGSPSRRRNPVEATLIDLGSTNGTFVNRQRIFTSVVLHPGDLIQLGPGGPEFQFDLEPKVAKPTRMAEMPVPGSVAAPTRQAAVPAAAMTTKSASAPLMQAQGSTTSVGKATVERMINQGKTQARKQMLWGGFALLLVVLAVGGFLLTRPKQSVTILNNSNNGVLSASEIAAKSTDAVVYIEAAWSLIDSSNGHTLSQVYFSNSEKDKRTGKEKPIVEGAGSTLPVFVAVKGSVEPLLSTDDGGGSYVPISESGSGTGFIVDSSGFILTNRHVAAGWETSYSGWVYHGDKAGILLTPTDKGFDVTAISADSFPSRWVPSQAKVIVEGKLSPSNLTIVRNQLGFANKVQGRNDVLNVTLAKSRIRGAGNVAKVSDHANVALLKIETPQPLAKVELNDNYDTVQPARHCYGDGLSGRLAADCSGGGID